MNEFDTSGGSLRLQGRALQAALAAGLVLMAAALWAAGVDYASEIGLNAGPLNALSILYKLISIVALVYVGYRIRSRSMWVLALLLSLLTLGHIVIDAGWWDDVANPITQRLETCPACLLGVHQSGVAVPGAGRDRRGIGLGRISERLAPKSAPLLCASSRSCS